MILSPDPFLRRFEPIRQVRRRRVAAYLLATAGVAVATFLRFQFSGLLAPVTFTTFYPAIALAALLGGAWPGTLALLLSALAANLLIMQPRFTWVLGSEAMVSTLMFLISGGILVVLIALLNDAVDRISQQAEATQQILEAQPVGVMLVDEAGIINFVNSRIEDLFGYSRAELSGQAVEILIPEGMRAGHAEALRRYMGGRDARRPRVPREFVGRSKGGADIPLDIGLTPFEAFGFTGALATLTDLRESRALQRREVVADEIRHRARNLLTIVQTLARRTLPRDDQQAFLGMLETIARTQDVLSAEITAPLKGILEDELRGFAHQIDDDGYDLRLSARAAQDFALIIHELTTNALKYGALSRPDGRVEITCRREADERSFTFIWKELRGPKVSPPTRRGFGSSILQDLARGFATSVEWDYPPDGFRYELRVDLARVGEVAEPHPAR
ncbi:PAS domain S-box protein [Phenylobacterium sp. LjRoot219]|uniref:sensor histidine kinase n=1 Tax=Phenylobacterium sp. LjRoot219 TaxID=3342283 RepID=UPI003ED0700B